MQLSKLFVPCQPYSYTIDDHNYGDDSISFSSSSITTNSHSFGEYTSTSCDSVTISDRIGPQAIVNSNDDVSYNRLSNSLKKANVYPRIQQDSNDEEETSFRSSSTSKIPSIKNLDFDPVFDSVFTPHDMKCLALVSNNNMMEVMQEFVISNQNILKKFRLTGTSTTMSMLNQVFGNDPEIIYGPLCQLGPVGGDVQLATMVRTGQLGGCIFFIDPMDAHAHTAEIDYLVRQGNFQKLLMLNNPLTAHVALSGLRAALKMGMSELLPSFFFDLETPSGSAYPYDMLPVEVRHGLRRDKR